MNSKEPLTQTSYEALGLESIDRGPQLFDAITNGQNAYVFNGFSDLEQVAQAIHEQRIKGLRIINLTGYSELTNPEKHALLSQVKDLTQTSKTRRFFPTRNKGEKQPQPYYVVLGLDDLWNPERDHPYSKNDPEKQIMKLINNAQKHCQGMTVGYSIANHEEFIKFYFSLDPTLRNFWFEFKEDVTID